MWASKQNTDDLWALCCRFPELCNVTYNHTYQVNFDCVFVLKGIWLWNCLQLETAAYTRSVTIHIKSSFYLENVCQS